jgi:hypothetical protein
MDFIKFKGIVFAVLFCGFMGLAVSNQCEARNRRHSFVQAGNQQKPTGMIGFEWYASETDQIHDVGKVWTCLSNHGVYGHADFQWANFEWPGGSGNDYNWEGRFWCGATVQGEDRVSHADYGNYEFYPVQGSGPLFVDRSGRTRIAVNYIGCRGAKSSLDSYVEYDDKASLLGHYPLKVAIHQRGLSWNMPDYDDFIAFEVAIANESMMDYNEFYIAWVFDADVCQLDNTDPHIDDLIDYDGWDGDDSRTDELPEVYPGQPYDRGDIVDPFDWDGDGNTGYDKWGVPFGDPDNPNYDESLIEPDGFPDEYTLLLDDGRGQRIAFKHPEMGDSIVVYGYAVPRNMSYIYDGDNLNTPEQDFQEREQLPYPCDGYIGGRILYTPNRLYASRAYYNYSGPHNTLSDSLMMPFCHSWWNWEQDPGSDGEKLAYMDGRHVAMRGKRYLVNPHHPDIDTTVFDHRWLQSMGPLQFQAGDTLKFVYVVGIGRGLQGLRENLDKALYLYYQGSLHSDPYHPSDFDADDHWKIGLYEGAPGDVTNDGNINVLDIINVIKHISGDRMLQGDALCNADCDANGRIEVVDVMGIVNVILGIGECEP